MPLARRFGDSSAQQSPEAEADNSLHGKFSELDSHTIMSVIKKLTINSM